MRVSGSQLGGQVAAGARPLEGLGVPIEVVDEGQDALPQFGGRGEAGPLEQPPHQDAEPNLDLIEPGGMLGQVDELNAMARVTQEGRPRRHRLHDAVLALHPQVVGDSARPGDQPHQGLGLMDVQLVHDEDVARIRPRRPDRRADQPAGGNLEVGDQALRAVPDVLELAALDVARLHRQGWGGALQRLDAGHLVGAEHMRAGGFQQRRGGVHVTHGRHLLDEDGWVGRLGREPIAAQVRLEVGLTPKSAPPSGARWREQCHD
jgi:hypothetical protein